MNLFSRKPVFKIPGMIGNLMKRASALARRGAATDAGAVIDKALRDAGLLHDVQRRDGQRRDDAAQTPNADDAMERTVSRSAEAHATLDVAFRDVTAERNDARADASAQPFDVDDTTGERSPSRDRARARATSNGRTAPLPSGFTRGAFASPFGARDYKLFVPTGFDDQRLPLIVMLHGCTQDPDDFAIGTRMNELAQTHGAIVLYPAQSPHINPNKCWNWFQRADQQRERGEPALLAAMTRQIIATAPVDPLRVYAAGLSAGGAMAAILGREYPDIFAAIGVHSGLPAGAAHDVPSAFAAMRRGVPQQGATESVSSVPTIVFHGDRDTTVHPDNGERILARGEDVRERRLEDGMPGKRYTRRRFTGPDGRTIGEHWTVHGIGHAWSGGSAQGTYTDVLGPDASAEMLRFFLEHPRVTH